jgi:hypothetical protein
LAEDLAFAAGFLAVDFAAIVMRMKVKKRMFARVRERPEAIGRGWGVSTMQADEACFLFPH